MSYTYNAVVVKVIDGDTIRCDVDLGFSIWSKMVFRLHGINTPEIVGKQKALGLKAKAHVESRILNKKVVIKTFKDGKDKYGRYLAQVNIDDVCLNDEMLELKLAAPYNGKTKK